MIFNSFTCMRGLSEFCATALFMLISCLGGTVTSDQNGANGNLMSSVHYGLAVVVIMHIFGFISGAHANPCVSIACCLLGYIGYKMMFLYVICQLAGAAFGYFLLLQMLTQGMIDGCKQGICIAEPMKSLSYVQILSIEGFLTAVLVLAWCALWDVRSGRFLDSVTLRMGCLVIACNLAGGQLTGATMNPGKLLIPTLFKGNPQTVLLQLGGQLLASIIVPPIWQYACTPRYKPLQADNTERPTQELYLTP
ncbi:GH20663 [Drosophila grimshawi]|uniref:GH20663 n=2 Tax=Drosophila grimshawi TaxID=7222 RepID=B4J7D2_DROGR|nr:GH20663 [Drosophila grimshawi]